MSPSNPPTDDTTPSTSLPILGKETELSKAMYNPLVKATKKADLKKTITSQQSSVSKKHDDNQISIQLENFEKKLIRNRRYKE